MSSHANITAIIGGTTISYINDFFLEETVGDHANFSFKVRGDYLEDSLSEVSVLNSSKEFLGENCSLEIKNVEDNGEKTLYFKGVITNVQGVKGDDEKGLADIIILTGKSSSFLLDNFSVINSYKEQTLYDIIDRSLGAYNRASLDVRINPEDNKSLFYSVQNGQSAFEYLQFLAATNAEYLLYNNETLYFGKPDLGEATALVYGFDLKDFKLGLEIQSLKFQYGNNDYFTDNHVSSSSNSSASSSGYTAFTSRVSHQMQVAKSEHIFPTYEDQDVRGRLDRAVELQKKVKEQSQVSLQGISTNTGVTLGGLVNIKSETDSFGEFRVVKVSHHCSENGKYSNTFVAVSTEIDIYPLTNIGAINKSDLQIGTVFNTVDPEGMSRVLVQFPWQKSSSETTPWLRVATLYAGGDRGMHFIPEVGDQVIVAFENGNVERPFVQSSLYTNANKQSNWQSDSNNYKGITTRVGHNIELNDTKGGEMITISDPKGNMICFDTVNNNVTVTAIENMIFNAKNLEINVQENMDITVGKNYTLNAKNSNENIDQNKTIDVAESYLQTSSEATIVASNGDMNIEGAGVATFQGGSDVKISKG